MELRGAADVIDTRLHLESRRSARPFALTLHRFLEAREVHREAALPRDVRGEIDREAEGVVELEHGLAVEHAVLALERAFQHLHPVVEGLREALLLLLQHLLHAVLRRHQLGVGCAHHLHQIGHERVKKRLLAAELVAVADGAADDPPQHVAASFVAGNDAVRDEETRRRECGPRSP